MPSFDIIMPSHGRPDLLEKTLGAIRDNVRPSGFNRLLLIENGGLFGAEELSRKYNRYFPISYFYSETPSLSNARNIGTLNSDSDFLLFFDSDVKPVTGALETYGHAFEVWGAQYFYGGPLYPEYATPPPEWMLEFLPWSVRGRHLGGTEKIVDKACFLGGNFAIPRAAIDKVGPFEGPCAIGTSGGGVGEETRLQERMLEQGYRGVYVPGGGVVHPVPKDACSIEFIINRVRRHGYTTAELAAHEEKFGRIWFDAPLFYWRQFILAALQLAQYINPVAGHSGRFRSLLNYHKQRAMLQAFRNIRRQNAHR